MVEPTSEPPRLEPLAIVLKAAPEPVTEKQKVLEWPLEAPWSGNIDLEPGTAWRVWVEAEGHWGPELELVPFSNDGELRKIHLLPTGQLAGRLLVPPSVLPGEIELDFEASPDLSRRESSESEKLVPTTTLRCLVDGKADFFCEAPAVTLDLKVRAANFIPHYFWDVEIEPGETFDLGSLELRAGASLVGWVLSPDPDETGEPTVIELAPRIMGWQGSPKEGRRTERRNLSDRVTDRGFFQLRSIPPGGYALTARRPGFADAVVPEIDIAEDEEVFLGEPLVFDLPGIVEAQIEPPVDARGRPWILRLVRIRRDAGNRRETVDESPASAEGRWLFKPLQHGGYIIEVADVDGSNWLREEVEVHADPHPVFLTVPLVPVEGRITMGGDPVEATLVFGSTQGVRSIRLRSNEEGVFEGSLPREGTWLIDLAFGEDHFQGMALDPVEVERSSGQRVARLDIELPDTRLEGRVVTEGEPVPEASVLIIREGGEGEKKSRQASLICDDNGEFEIFGFPPGSLIVNGSYGQRSSPWVRVDIQEGLEAPLLLVELEREIDFSGQVLFGSNGIPGVQFRAQPIVNDASSGVAAAEKAVSNADGSFSLSLPASTVALDLLVIPPGFAAYWARWPVGDPSVPSILQLTPEAGRLNVELAGAMLEGVLVFEGSSLPLPFLLSTMLPLGRATFDGEGFVIEKMKPGSYSYCLGDQCNSGYLPPSGELLLTLP